MSESAFNLLHRKIQQAIWDQKWQELRPLQVDSIKAFNNSSSSIVLSAATASGKTEAAFLPVLSNIASEPQDSVQALYIGPLKALINDQYNRLKGLCEHAQIPVHRWHGDVPQSQKNKLRREPRGVLLITPESLESNFVNHARHISKMYLNLEYIIVDELHAFIGQNRGIHLRSLLSRLRAFLNSSPRLVGLSATLGDFYEAKKFLNPDDPTSVLVIEDKSYQRELRVVLKGYLRHDEPTPESEGEAPPLSNTASDTFELYDGLDPEDILNTPNNPLKTLTNRLNNEVAEPSMPKITADIIKAYAGSSNLIFCNSRSLTERIADSINVHAQANGWGANPFLVHHGSLSMDVRHETERRLKKGDKVTVICTSTLEMGIDIGSVRAVGQVGSPYTVSSLVQRLGRSGRKDGDPSILRFYTIDVPPTSGCEFADLLFPDLVRGVAMVDLLASKWIESPKVSSYDASTFIHQIISVLKQTGGVRVNAIYKILCVHGPFRSFDVDLFKDVLRSLSSNEIIEQMASGEIILSPKGEMIACDRSFYAAFVTTEEYSVRCKSEEIAKLPLDSVPMEGELILLNGRRWIVENIYSESRIVEVIPSIKGRAPYFLGNRGEIDSYVVARMRFVLSGNNKLPFLPAESQQLLDSARLIFSRCGLKSAPLIKGNQNLLWLPWVGTRAMRTLKLASQHLGFSGNLDDHELTLKFPPDTNRLYNFLKGIISESLEPVELASLMPSKHYERFDNLLSESLLDRINSIDRLDIPEARCAARSLLNFLEQQ